MNGRLTRGELRIIENTKKEGEEFYSADKAGKKDDVAPAKDNGTGDITDISGSGDRRKTNIKTAVLSIVVFAIVFTLLAFTIKIIVSLLS